MDNFLITLPVEVLKTLVQLADPHYGFRDNDFLDDRIVKLKKILEDLGQ